MSLLHAPRMNQEGLTARWHGREVAGVRSSSSRSTAHGSQAMGGGKKMPAGLRAVLKVNSCRDVVVRKPKRRKSRLHPAPGHGRSSAYRGRKRCQRKVPCEPDPVPWTIVWTAQSAQDGYVGRRLRLRKIDCLTVASQLSARSAAPGCRFPLDGLGVCSYYSDEACWRG